MLTIRKGDQIKEVTELSWELMGDNKNGWSIVTEKSETVVNEVAPPLPTGDIEKVNNTAVTNEAPVATESEQNNSIVNEVAPPAPAAEIQNEISEPDSFIDFVKANISKQKVKDYLDSKEIAYKANSSIPVLGSLLKEHLHNDIDLLQLEFGLGL